MCELKVGERTRTCLEILAEKDMMAGRVCLPCHREAEDGVIASADGFYDLMHSSSFAVIPANKAAIARIDKAVQILRKVRSNWKFGGN